MTLKEEIAALEAKRKRPPEVVAILRKAIDELSASGSAMGLKIGERAPDFSLPNQIGKPVTLSGRLAKGPVVLTFYRGIW